MPLPLLLAAAICIASVHDGDTIRLCDGERVRLQGIDAPELQDSPRCSPASLRRLAGSRNPPWCDYEAGEASRATLSAFLHAGPVNIQRLGQDDYGRTLAKLSMNGRDAGEYMIRRGVARPWR